jgi:hypothetical protein
MTLLNKDKDLKESCCGPEDGGEFLPSKSSERGQSERDRATPA